MNYVPGEHQASDTAEKRFGIFSIPGKCLQSHHDAFHGRSALKWGRRGGSVGSQVCSQPHRPPSAIFRPTAARGGSESELCCAGRDRSLSAQVRSDIWQTSSPHKPRDSEESTTPGRQAHWQTVSVHRDCESCHTHPGPTRSRARPDSEARTLRGRLCDARCRHRRAQAAPPGP